jgi:hypothetical protein
MLKNLSIDQINRIAELAEQARSVRDLLLNKMYQTEADETPKPRGERNPSALDSLEVVQAADDSGIYDRLRQSIESLSPEAQAELRALMWVGRGDFAAGDWDEALTQASGTASLTTVDTLSDKADLHDYLMKGLYKMDLR